MWKEWASKWLTLQGREVYKVQNTRQKKVTELQFLETDCQQKLLSCTRFLICSPYFHQDIYIWYSKKAAFNAKQAKLQTTSVAPGAN